MAEMDHYVVGPGYCLTIQWDDGGCVITHVDLDRRALALSNLTERRFLNIQSLAEVIEATLEAGKDVALSQD